MLLLLLVDFNSFIFVILLVPLFLLLRYLLMHRETNGSIGILKRALLAVTFATLFYFIAEVLSVVNIIFGTHQLTFGIVLPVLTGSILLVIAYIYAWITIRKLVV